MEPSAGESSGGWAPPAVFDDYRLVRKLGSGGSGEVYLAQDQLLDRAVSVKFLRALDEESLVRFMMEARAAARIQHPNVVTLYRVGKLEQRPFLVSEYAKGRSLDRLPKPLDWNAALFYAVDLCRGLCAAHRCGVLHRDLKPANAILTESGDVKLLDFGLAKLLREEAPAAGDLRPAPGPPLAGPPAVSMAGVVVGTPYYLAPEIWRGEPASVRSDLYSLGALLYELCAGHPPGHDLGDDLPLPAAVQRRDAPRLAEVAPAVGPAFAAIVDRCLRRDPAERFAAADEVLDALELLASRGPRGPLPEGNPYRGLQPFEAAHRALFFGRRQSVQAVLDRLRGEPFLALTGDSGVGKSSLCLAGVLPAVAEGQLLDQRTWQVARMVPGRAPCEALAAALAPALGVPERALEALVREGPQPFVRQVRAALRADRGLLLYVDQLEELVTLSAPESAALVAAALEPLAAGLPGLRLLGSTRSDFLTRLAALPGLGAHLPRAVLLVRALSADELREAVKDPARMKGVRFESEALVSELVASAERAEGGLPLLQFALAELWEARDAATQVITARSVEAIGGVGGALARHAESVLRALLPEQRAAARVVLLRLVTADGTRARRSEAELWAVHPFARAALEALVRGRLVVAREADGAAAYEIAHEAILAGCATLAGWLGEEAGTRAARERLSLAAAEWERRGRDRELLWRARSLEEAAHVREDGLTPGEREFLEASRRATRRRRTSWRAAAGAGAALVVASGVLGWIEVERRAERRAVERIARTRLAQARAQAAVLQPQRAAAFQLFDQGNVEAGERAWNALRAAERDAAARYDEATTTLESEIALGGPRDDLRREMGQAFLELAEVAEDARKPEVLDAALERMRDNDPDGLLERTWSRPATVQLREPAGAAIGAVRYERHADGRFEAVPAPVSGTVPSAVTLPPGSYLFQVGSVRCPLLLRRGETRTLAVPAEVHPPPGFAFIPGGQFLFGSGDEDSVRRFFDAVPMRPAETGPFLIARTETTYRQWLEFLRALPREELPRRIPHVSGSGLPGAIQLLPPAGPGGVWAVELAIPGGAAQRAKEGQDLVFPGRTVRKSQSWGSLPVAGVSFEDAQAYARWLDATGRVPGARLCTESEWEHAARGADGRAYPHGDRLTPDEANIDETYAKVPSAFGPDEVGSHPQSRNPFGIDDLAGNVWEWTTSANGVPVLRGGAYYYAAGDARTANRFLPEPTFRDPTAGIRLCASIPKPSTQPPGSHP